jgi:mono/diheme cytochrome c family protein
MPAARDIRSLGRLNAGALAALALLALAGCDRMAKQAKDKPYESRDKPGAAAVAAPVAGTIARETVDDGVPKLDLALLQRGRERFDIYCAPCHGRTGDGQGMIVRRGFPAPPSYHSDRLRAASEQHLYEVISQGYGAMFAYGRRIAPRDRWAIIAYIRALQLSQHSDMASLDAAGREALP